LPILLEDSTKCARAIMQTGKEYICLMRLHGEVSDEKLLDAIKLFTGQIYQIPPVRSSVARKPRIRTIYSAEIIERSGRDVLLRIACSGGTYIRKYCYDVGLYLGCGAHMQELRRTRAGPYDEGRSVTLLDVYEAVKLYKENGEERTLRGVVQPVETAVKFLPKVYVLDSAVDAICHGADLAVAGISKLDEGIKRGDEIAIMTLKGELVALGRAQMSTEEILDSTKGIAVDIDRVIMNRGTYPSVWKKGSKKFNDSI
jgi:H/ACA ribonucleoprotein complex subunit 4